MSFTLTRRAAPAAFAALLLAGCVSEQRYDELNRAYQQLQAQYSADQATIQMLEGRLKVTMNDRILFPSGGYQITFSIAAAAAGRSLGGGLHGLGTRDETREAPLTA